MMPHVCSLSLRWLSFELRDLFDATLVASASKRGIQEGANDLFGAVLVNKP
jgi:hypothetical protein